MRDIKDDHLNRPSAREDLEHARDVVPSPQSQAASYRLAFADPDFLLREELRPVRLQLELLKPELELQAMGVESTVVVYGSARIGDPEEARAALASAEAAAAGDPENPARRHEVERCRRAVARSRYYDEARRFGRLVSEHAQSGPVRQFVVVTGGGPGIMEAANRGAAETGSVTIGLNITLPHEQAPNRWVTPELSFQFHYFALRKMHFLMRARALVVFPGGFGTLDELFESLCLMQTQKVRKIPVLLFDRDYWERIVDFDALLDEEVVSADDLELFSFVDTAEEAWRRIQEHYGLVPEATGDVDQPSESAV
ncbi:MAG: TIGR00730 family Rossman fold protein [Geminicoccaceae bacterium]